MKLAIYKISPLEIIVVHRMVVGDGLVSLGVAGRKLVPGVVFIHFLSQKFSLFDLLHHHLLLCFQAQNLGLVALSNAYVFVDLLRVHSLQDSGLSLPLLALDFFDFAYALTPRRSLRIIKCAMHRRSEPVLLSISSAQIIILVQV
jgi:hypothetical protein